MKTIKELLIEVRDEYVRVKHQPLGTIPLCFFITGMDIGADDKARVKTYIRKNKPSWFTNTRFFLSNYSQCTSQFEAFHFIPNNQKVRERFLDYLIKSLK
jgi:hypothetical protein